MPVVFLAIAPVYGSSRPLYQLSYYYIMVACRGYLCAVSVVLLILQKNVGDNIPKVPKGFPLSDDGGDDGGGSGEVIRSGTTSDYLAFVAAIAAAAAIWGVAICCRVTCCRKPVARIPVCCPHRSLCAFCQHISSFSSLSSSSSTNFIATQVLQKLQGRGVSRVSLVSVVLLPVLCVAV